MSDFTAAAFGFPAALFSAALIVVIAFWLLVLCGAAEHDGPLGHTYGHAAGVGGVPVTVTVSLAVAVAWFACITGSVLVARLQAPDAVRAGLDVGVLAAALLLAWGVTRFVVRRFRGLFPDLPPPSRLDFIGLTCTIRTGSVSASFGQAEVAAADGSTAVVQVRQHGHDDLRSGSTALLYAFDEDGEFFWVAPFDPALDPRATA
ncbi:hypothetical protein ACIBEA_06910 [Streptomyces sp. NPDC051555]|uniref:hypothetical protein n=1 Tax=Streptomyces sp. NPDC051555 TaxID=3365657 RepID=UPI0037AC7566